MVPFGNIGKRKTSKVLASLYYLSVLKNPTLIWEMLHWIDRSAIFIKESILDHCSIKFCRNFINFDWFTGEINLLLQALITKLVHMCVWLYSSVLEYADMPWWLDKYRITVLQMVTLHVIFAVSGFQPL